MYVENRTELATEILLEDSDGTYERVSQLPLTISYIFFETQLSIIMPISIRIDFFIISFQNVENRRMGNGREMERFQKRKGDGKIGPHCIDDNYNFKYEK